MLLTGGRLVSETDTQVVPVGSSCLPEADYMSELDRFLRDGEVPSPGNMYFVGSPIDTDMGFFQTSFDGSCLTSYGNSSACYNSSNVGENELMKMVKKEPVDRPLCPTVTVQDASSDCTSETEGMEQVQSLLLEHLARDIDEACNTLGIDRDPSRWSVEDVRKWILSVERRYGSAAIPVENFNVDGVELVLMTEEDFRLRAAQCADILYFQLDIWKSAANMRRSGNPNCPQITMDIQQMDAVAHDALSLAFKPEDSVLDIGSYLPLLDAPMHQLRVMAPSPSSLSVSDDCATMSHLSDYGSDVSFRSDDENTSDDCGRSDKDHSMGPMRGALGGAPVGTSHSHIHLWQFLKELLLHPQLYGCCIRWMDRPQGVFKIEDSVRVARLWGKRKNRPAMNYDKLSRSIRQYYKKGIMKKTERSQRLVYQFCHPYYL